MFVYTYIHMYILFTLSYLTINGFILNCAHNEHIFFFTRSFPPIIFLPFSHRFILFLWLNVVNYVLKIINQSETRARVGSRGANSEKKSILIATTFQIWSHYNERNLDLRH